MTRFLLGCLVMALVLTMKGESHNVPNSEHNRVHAVTHAFCGSLKPCRLGNEALAVAYCESGPNLWPYARNGRYWGMFQVSDHWRATVPGWSWSPWAEARHAYRVWRLVGWSHWECA